MKFRNFLLMVFPFVLLAGCGKNNIDLVKDNIHKEFSNAISIGQAFDNFQGCKPKTQKWTSFTTDNGMQIVEFECVAQDLLDLATQARQNYFERYPRASIEKKRHLAISNIRYLVQFVIAKDKESFDVQASALEYVWDDGRKFYTGQNEELIRRIYANKSIMDNMKGASLKDKQPLFELMRIRFSAMFSNAKK